MDFLHEYKCSSGYLFIPNCFFIFMLKWWNISILCMKYRIFKNIYQLLCLGSTACNCIVIVYWSDCAILTFSGLDNEWSCMHKFLSFIRLEMTLVESRKLILKTGNNNILIVGSYKCICNAGWMIFQQSLHIFKCHILTPRGEMCHLKATCS